MASITKRQQARNERTLHDLVQRVPGNNTCADCSAVNPGTVGLRVLLRDGLLTCPCYSLGIMECTRPRFFMLLPAANPLRFDETAS